MHATSQQGLEDMSGLADLHEGAILYNISQRYRANKIYTYIGSILSAVNPYQPFDKLYAGDQIALYNKKNIGELPPHIFAIANEAYYAMWKTCVSFFPDAPVADRHVTGRATRWSSSRASPAPARPSPPSSS